MNTPNSSSRATLLRALAGYSLALAALIFTARSIGTGWAMLSKAALPLSLQTITTTTLLMLGHTLLNRAAFTRLSQAMGVEMTPASLRRIWGRSLLAKYVPGGIWQIVGRAVLMKKYGVRHSQAIAIGLAEQLVSLSTCIFLAAAAFAALKNHFSAAAIVLALGLIFITLSCHLPFIHDRGAAKRAFALYLLAMPFYLAAYSTMAKGVPLIDLTTQLFAGTAAGMMAFFVPGGLGVRESVATLLSSSQSSSLLAAMVSVRLITLLVETCINLTALLPRATPDLPQPRPHETPTISKVFVTGVALGGDGYPNARNTIEILKKSPDIEIIDNAHWLPRNFHLWKLSRESLHVKIASLFRLSAGSALLLFRTLASYRPGDTIYLPYPSLPSLWLLSWIPLSVRPRVFVDAYITLWDSFYQDRQLGNQSSITARCLRWAESRALRAAHLVLVDTAANAEHLASLYGVDQARVHSLPLAALPLNYAPPEFLQRSRQHKTRVLFVGTFVPLQGTTVIAQAINILQDRHDLEFVLIGNGQLADEAASLLDGINTLTWHRDWQSFSTIESEIAQSDICLGVFGGEGKAARVLPFKLYMALAAGKAIITQSAYSTPTEAPALPVWTCAATPQALAQAIVELSADTSTRAILQTEARAYFNQYLADSNVARHWRGLLEQKTGNE